MSGQIKPFWEVLKLFWSDVQNNFRFSSGKFGGKHRNQQTITCQVLAEINKIWSCLIFIKLYSLCISLTPTSVFTEKCVTHSLKMHLHGRMSLYRFFLRFTSCSPWLQEYSDWFLRLSLKLFNAWKINILNCKLNNN